MGKASGGRFARRCAPGYHINGQGAETATLRIIIMTYMDHDVLTDQRTAVEKIWRNLSDLLMRNGRVLAKSEFA